MEPHSDASPHRPEYPPHTPPPPKRPISPPRPSSVVDVETWQLGAAGPYGTLPARGTRRIATVVRNRQVANWTLEHAPWTPAKASRLVVNRILEWGYTPTMEVRGTVETVAGLLTAQALENPGTSPARRVSVHLSDQDGQVCVLAIAHQTAEGCPADDGEDVLRHLSEHAAVTACGTDTGLDGARWWAVIDLAQ